MTVKWHGYEQKESAHYLYPWWVEDDGEWYRSDYDLIEGPDEVPCSLCAWDAVWEKKWAESEAMPSKEDWAEFEALEQTLDETLARIDRELPLPVPELKLGQGWSWLLPGVDPEARIRVSAMILAFDRGGPCWFGIVPPNPLRPDAAPGAALVTGEGSPWQAPEEKDPSP